MAINNPYALDLPSGYIDINVDGLAVNDPDIGDFTIECWMYVRGGSYNLSTGANTSDTGIVMSYQSGSPFIGVKTRTDYYRLNPTVSQYPVNRWAHFALTWDRAKREAKFYLDGEYVSVLPRVSSGSTKSSRTHLRINAPSNSTAYQGNAIYDELRIWSVVRTEEEINKYMNRYLTPFTPGLKRLIRFDDNAPTVSCDITGITGTISGNSYAWVEGKQDLYFTDIVFPSDVVELKRYSHTSIDFDVVLYDDLEYRVEVRFIDGGIERVLHQEIITETSTIEAPISTHNLELGKDYTVKVIVTPLTIPDDFIEKTVLARLKSNKPDIHLDLKGYDLNITIEDADDDEFVYMIKLNDSDLLPTQDGRAYAKGKIVFNHKLDSKQVEIGKANNLYVYAEDETGLSNEITHVFLGEYFGLLFSDEDYNLYSNDIGEILRVMKIPPLRAGEISDIHKVILTNKQPFKVRDIRLWLRYYEEVPNTILKFSKTRTPFMLEDELLYEGVFEPYEEIEFFIRLFTSKGAKGKGKFDVVARAIPVIE